MFNFHDRMIANAHPAIVTGSIIQNSLIVDPDRSPNNQKVISASFISLSAKYFISPTREDISPPTARPQSISIILDLFLNVLEINNVKATATNPKINANALIKALEKPIKIAKHAPTLAPLETPNKSGETSLLLKVLW